MQPTREAAQRLRRVLFDARAGNSNLAKSLIEYDFLRQNESSHFQKIEQKNFQKIEQ